MIIPIVSVTEAEAGSAESLIERLLHWGLFGKVLLCQAERMPVEPLLGLIQQIGGKVELLIRLEEQSPLEPLSLLNAGAAGIVSNQLTPAKIPGEVWHPYQRLTAGETVSGKLVEIPTGLAEPQTTSAWMVEESHRGNSLLVDAQWLDQHPESLVDYLEGILVSDREDRLWPTLVVDSLGLALGLAYSNRASLLDAIQHRRGTYWSRSRNSLWIKGASSGAEQRLLGIRWDCDRDCLRFQVQQQPPGFCHLETQSCFGPERTMEGVIQRLQQRILSEDQESFTKKLAGNRDLLKRKLLEEAEELAVADSREEIAFEAADVLYFTLVRMLSGGVAFEEVCQELFRRMSRVERRPDKLEVTE